MAETTRELCALCGATGPINPSWSSWKCPECQTGWVYVRCEKCRVVSGVRLDNFRRLFFSYDCSECNHVNRSGGLSGRSSKDYAAPAKAHIQRLLRPPYTHLLDDPTYSVLLRCVVVEQVRLPQWVTGANASVSLSRTRLRVTNHSLRKAIAVKPADLSSCSFADRSYTTGGGFIGGGFGLTGAAEGILMAKVLNRATTKHTVLTGVHVRLRDGTAVQLLAPYPLAQVQHRFSPFLMSQQVEESKKRMELAQRNAELAAVPPPVQAPAPVDVVSQLERLAVLRRSGALTDEEFAQLKSKLL